MGFYTEHFDSEFHKEPVAEDSDSTIQGYFIHSRERGSRGFMPQKTSLKPMISEGSCDTEDWSNDAENSALITGINNILQ